MWGRDLEDVEGVVRTPIGDAHEVPLDYFFETVLPPPPSDVKIEAVLDNRALRRRRVVTKDSRWWGYSKKKPGNGSGMNFSKNYYFLERGIRRVIDTVKKAKSIVKFHVNQEGEPLFDNRTDESLPDAFFLTTPLTGASVRWENIAVIGEFSRFADNDSEAAVARKVVSSMAHCMRADPCRRFIYAFTAENEKTRLWYGDRSQVLVTEAFCFIENYRTLLSFAVHVSFAQPNQLGWDPTMERTESGDQTQYQITVYPFDGDTSTYRTLGILSDSGASRLLSRGTRVWKAVKIVNGEETGEPVALKDVWVDSDREREGDVHQRFFNSDYLARQHPELRGCFITVVAHGDVVNMGSTDCTPSFASQGTHTRLQTHYRVVYAEIGEPLRNITSLHVIFQALVDAVKGASAMHTAGWVHRDLSAGNILVVEGRGRIHDLEFATDDTHSETVGRTGTADFVAVEVDKQEYLFPPSTRQRDESPISSSSETSRGSESLPASPPHLSPRPTFAEIKAIIAKIPVMPEFRYNALHDLESIWWNAVYFTLNREIDESAGVPLPDSPDRRIAQRHSARKLFYQLEERCHAVVFHGFFIDHLACLHPMLNDIGQILEDMRLALRDAYIQAEMSIAHIDPAITRGLGDRMCVQFTHAAVVMKDMDIIVRRFND